MEIYQTGKIIDIPKWDSEEEIELMNVDLSYAKWLTAILKTFMKYNVNNLATEFSFEGKQYTIEDAVNEIISIADEYISLRNDAPDLKTEKDLLFNFKYAGRLFTEVMPYMDYEPRTLTEENVTGNAEASIYGNGPFFLLITAEEWNHDADEWLGIYVSKKEAREAYDRAIVRYEEAKSMYSSQQQVTMVEYIPEEDRFRMVDRHELDEEG